MLVRQLPESAKMWYIGNAVMAISRPCSSPPPIHAETCCRLATRLPWVSIAPFDTPVVPPVYCRKAMSSCVSAGSLRAWRAPSASADLKAIGEGSFAGRTSFFTCRTTKFATSPLGKPRRSPSAVVTTVRTGVRAAIPANVGAKFSRTTSATAPESLSWYSSSRGV